MDAPSLPTMTKEVIESKLHALQKEQKRARENCSASLAARAASSGAAHKRARATASPGAGDRRKSSGTHPEPVMHAGSPVSPSLAAVYDRMMEESPAQKLPELPELSPSPTGAPTLDQMRGHAFHIGGIQGDNNTIRISSGATSNYWASMGAALNASPNHARASALMDELLREKAQIERQAKITLLQELLPGVRAANQCD